MCNACDTDTFGICEETGTPVDPAARHRETCQKCNGRGRFVSWSGRVLGDCFACKGKGFREFATSADARAKSRQSAQRRREREAQERANEAALWASQHVEEIAWLDRAARRGFDFAASLLESFNKWGSLTDGQLAAVRKLIAKDAQRDAERAQREAAAPTAEVAAIEAAFASAREHGIRSPKLRLDTFVFSPAGAHSANAGAIYVKEGEDYLGKIVGGRFIRVRACTDDQEARIVAAAANPGEAAVAYGKRFGRCSICGRELTNQESIDRGIGPICADRFGF